MARSSYPIPPTSSLPPLLRLHGCSTNQIEQVLLNLHAIYRSRALLDLSASSRAVPSHKIHDLSVPDSGYASAEEDELEDDSDEEEDSDIHDLDVLRSDALERDFTIRWLTAFVARSDTWVYDPALPEEEDKRTRLVDDAASLLASFAGEDEEVAVTRTFSFPRASHLQGGPVEVELNDAPLLTEDHTSVGLQSWGSSIILAEQICTAPDTYGLSLPSHGKKLRILELGAGTGLLSIAAGKLLQSLSPEIVATDYHPSVLRNLEANVATNFPISCETSIAVTPLDWQKPVFDAPLHEPFDVILAADVIYHPEHAKWIKDCVEQLLVRPNTGCPHVHKKHGIFWLIIPVRSTGRHEGMGSTVEAVFPRSSTQDSAEASVAGAHDTIELAILSARRMGKHDGVGRADESGYTLFEIGWVPSSLL